MGGLSLFLSSKTAAALASMLLFTCCLRLCSTLERERTREEVKELVHGMMGVLETASLLPGEGRVEMFLPLKGGLRLKGRTSGGKQVVEIWSGGELLLSQILSLPVENESFEKSFSSPCFLTVIKRENFLVLEGR